MSIYCGIFSDVVETNLNSSKLLIAVAAQIKLISANILMDTRNTSLSLQHWINNELNNHVCGGSNHWLIR
jgi:hypothetical protein